MKRRRKLWILTALLGAVFILAVGVAAAGTVLEDNDNFCIACHTTPEVTYYDRAQQALKAKAQSTDIKQLSADNVAVDLASQHAIVTDTLHCIACHGGNRNLADRAESLTLGLKDTLKYLVGQANQTIEKTTTGDPELINRACVRCHAETLLTVKFENHFHVKLPQTWQLIEQGAQPIVSPDMPQALTDPRSKPELLNTTVTCLSCHQAHRANLGFTNYLDQNGVVLPACAQCHSQSGRGPVGIAR
jgi:predicted CXXCH cytochrome family protein